MLKQFLMNNKQVQIHTWGVRPGSVLGKLYLLNRDAENRIADKQAKYDEAKRARDKTEATYQNCPTAETLIQSHLTQQKLQKATQAFASVRSKSRHIRALFTAQTALLREIEERIADVTSLGPAMFQGNYHGQAATDRWHKEIQRLYDRLVTLIGPCPENERLSDADVVSPVGWLPEVERAKETSSPTQIPATTNETHLEPKATPRPDNPPDGVANVFLANFIANRKLREAAAAKIEEPRFTLICSADMPPIEPNSRKAKE